MHSIEILGVRVDMVQPDDARGIVQGWFAEPRRFHYISSTNLNNLVHATKSEQFKTVTNTADLSIPDGMPLVWYGRYLGYRMPEKCGIEELMVELFRLSEDGATHRHFFYGNTPAVLDDLRRELTRRYPKLEIAGTYSPPFRPLTSTEHDDIIQMINESGADFVWVSLGCPKQETWLFENRSRLQAVAGGGAGAVFNFLAGHSATAPRWVKYTGLEWLLRLATDPKRLWRRYLVEYPNLVFRFWRSREWRRRSSPWAANRKEANVTSS